MIELTQEEARRIAMRAQLLDGSASGVLETVRRLGFLQIDPISVIAPPQQLVLWSRLGPYDVAELDRLLWEERKLFEFDAFIWPIEDLPLLRARMRRRRPQNARENWNREFLRENAALRRSVLRDLEVRGPLPSREIQGRADRQRHAWWGNRQMALLLELLADRGELAVAGRAGGQRLWDLAGRVYPETERIPWREAQKLLEEKRFRSLGVHLERGRLVAHPEAVDGPVQRRVTFLSPFDRLIHDRARAEVLFGLRYRLEMYVPKANREFGYYVLPILNGDRIVGRIEPVFDRRARALRVNGLWWEPGVRQVSLDRPLRSLARFLGAESVEMPGA